MRETARYVRAAHPAGWYDADMFGHPIALRGMNAMDISENMKRCITSKGYDLDDVELLDLRGKFDPKVVGSFTEGVFKTGDGRYFKCGEGMPKSNYELRAGLLVRAGTRLFELTEDEAKEWIDNKDMSIYPVQ